MENKYELLIACLRVEFPDIYIDNTVEKTTSFIDIKALTYLIEELLDCYLNNRPNIILARGTLQSNLSYNLVLSMEKFNNLKYDMHRIIKTVSRIKLIQNQSTSFYESIKHMEIEII